MPEQTYKLKSFITKDVTEIVMDDGLTVDDLQQKYAEINKLGDSDIKLIHMGSILKPHTKLCEHGTNMVTFYIKKEPSVIPDVVSESVGESFVPNASAETDVSIVEPSVPEVSSESLSDTDMCSIVADALASMLIVPENRLKLISLIGSSVPELKDMITTNPGKVKEICSNPNILKPIIVLMMASSMASSNIIPEPSSSSLSDDDNKIIHEIMEMLAASKSSVTQAYIVCNKNREHTINFLLDS